jgi:hypothetical protein
MEELRGYLLSDESISTFTVGCADFRDPTAIFRIKEPVVKTALPSTYLLSPPVGSGTLPPFGHTCVSVAGIHPKGNQDGFPIKNVGNDNLTPSSPPVVSGGMSRCTLKKCILDGDSGRPFTWSSRINILLIKFEFLVRVLPSYFGNPKSEIRHNNTYRNNSFSFS